MNDKNDNPTRRIVDSLSDAEGVHKIEPEGGGLAFGFNTPSSGQRPYSMSITASMPSSTAKTTVPGRDFIEEGGRHPSVVLYGELQDPDGNPVTSQIMGEDGILILPTTPETVMSSAMALLGSILTEEQWMAAESIIETFAEETLSTGAMTVMHQRLHEVMHSSSTSAAFLEGSETEVSVESAASFIEAMRRTGVSPESLVKIEEMLGLEGTGMQERMEGVEKILKADPNISEAQMLYVDMSGLQDPIEALKKLMEDDED